MATTSATKIAKGSIDSAKAALLSTFIASLAINVLLSGVMSQMLGMINSLQLIVHLPIFSVPFPAIC